MGLVEIHRYSLMRGEGFGLGLRMCARGYVENIAIIISRTRDGRFEVWIWGFLVPIKARALNDPGIRLRGKTWGMDMSSSCD